MTYFLRHQCSCSWVENSSKTTPETPHRYSFDDERQHAMSRRNISRKRKKNEKTHSLSQLVEQTDGKQSSRSFLTRLRIRDSDRSSTGSSNVLYIWDVLWTLHEHLSERKQLTSSGLPSLKMELLKQKCEYLEVRRTFKSISWFSTLLLCVFVLKCKLCCYFSISLLSSSSNTNDFLVVSKSNDVTSV